MGYYSPTIWENLLNSDRSAWDSIKDEDVIEESRSECDRYSQNLMEQAFYGLYDPLAELCDVPPQGMEVENGLFNVKNFVEKPAPENAPSDLAIIGRYLLTPEIFDILANQEPGAGGEIQLTDAIDTLNKTQRVFAHQFTGKRYDVGDKFGFLKTSIEYGLVHPEVKDNLKEYLIELGKELAPAQKEVKEAPKASKK